VTRGWADGSELGRLVADLRTAPHRVGVKAVQVVRKTALDVEADAKALVPVDTGNLRSSIGRSERSWGGDGIEVEVGPTAFYGGFVEWGTSRHGPQAYMGPALNRREPAFVAAMEALMGEVLP
jgi:HK97 gp10 family phage protein